MFASYAAAFKVSQSIHGIIYGVGVWLFVTLLRVEVSETIIRLAKPDASDAPLVLPKMGMFSPICR